jgi:hypothetical protein
VCVYIYIYIYIYIYTHTHTHTQLNNLVIFHTVYHLIYLTISIINFNIFIIYVQYLLVLTIDNTTTAGINYKELYNCKWDPLTLMNNTLHTVEFKFL